ncbi:uncharacterized protein MYCFIDRAFT_180654 [Pseudocercospora fijiensis CIRAD86]|uniref:Secreted protein n=1 Tax=Pseudocercospora fijiensis (strain CIRAD86) TaxID=383855 RepID=M2YGA6_PSEFD|nr:uncharacterized protein MYCFIDRAFT_180654 [Pseudocercospora fijiensis CIRAD86]EME76835.1 hypothetical protein MYCFIDRAFT_180654 [Pseudocercospora fijiensis CIRAD86]
MAAHSHRASSLLSCQLTLIQLTLIMAAQLVMAAQLITAAKLILIMAAKMTRCVCTKSGVGIEPEFAQDMIGFTETGCRAGLHQGLIHFCPPYQCLICFDLVTLLHQVFTNS